MSNNVFKVNSSDHKQVYTIQIKEVTCSIASCCIPRCTFPECRPLCRHKIECKHAHKVNMLLKTRQPEEGLSISMPEHDEVDTFFKCFPHQRSKYPVIIYSR